MRILVLDDDDGPVSAVRVTVSAPPSSSPRVVAPPANPGGIMEIAIPRATRFTITAEAAGYITVILGPIEPFPGDEALIDIAMHAQPRITAPAEAEADCRQRGLTPGRSALLRSQDVPPTFRFCSRPGPPSFDQTWNPSQAEVQALEERLCSLAGRRSTLCCMRGAELHDVNVYLRQYIGIVVGDERFIYVNAFSSGGDSGLTTGLVDHCDGGTGSWGAIYQPATGEFVDLAFNGLP